MKTANDVELRHRFGVTARGRLERLFERHRVGARLTFLPPEGAQPTGSDTYIGRINVSVHIEVGEVSMQTLANIVRQPSDGQNIAAPVELHSVLKREPVAF